MDAKKKDAKKKAPPGLYPGGTVNKVKNTKNSFIKKIQRKKLFLNSYLERKNYKKNAKF